jgi:hypothetical protein
MLRAMEAKKVELRVFKAGAENEIVSAFRLDTLT